MRQSHPPDSVWVSFENHLLRPKPGWWPSRHHLSPWSRLSTPTWADLPPVINPHWFLQKRRITHTKSPSALPNLLSNKSQHMSQHSSNFNPHHPESDGEIIVLLKAIHHRVTMRQLSSSSLFRLISSSFFPHLWDRRAETESVDSKNRDDDLVYTDYIVLDTALNAVKFKFNSRQLHKASACTTRIQFLITTM